MLSGIEFGDLYYEHPEEVRRYLHALVELELVSLYGSELEWERLREKSDVDWEKLGPREKHLVATLVACLSALANPTANVWRIRTDLSRFPKAPSSILLTDLFRKPGWSTP